MSCTVVEPAFGHAGGTSAAVWIGYMANLGWPVVAILAVCMVVGQICFVAAQYTLAKWSYTSLAEQQKATCAVF